MAKQSRSILAWLDRQPAATKRLFIHDVQLAHRESGAAGPRSSTRGPQPAADWWAANQRTLAEREAFAELLLALDADPFLGERQPQIDRGCRAIGFTTATDRFGVVYQVIAARNAIRIISITHLA